MKPTLAFLLSTAAALLTLNSANAAPIAPSATPAATSYAELLEPVPNASETLIADDLARAQQKPLLQLVQFHHHHHHHHHHQASSAASALGWASVRRAMPIAVTAIGG